MYFLKQGLVKKMNLTAASRMKKLKEVQHLADTMSRRNKNREKQLIEN